MILRREVLANLKFVPQYRIQYEMRERISLLSETLS